MDQLASADVWLSLLSLTAMEIVLGIDNIVFISILVARLPPDKRDFARRAGIAAALLTRLALLFTISWVMKLTAPWFHILGHALSGKDLILIGGGLFLLGKATMEIHHKLEGEDPADTTGGAKRGSSTAVIAQIMVIDLVFSLDSVITAVGMAKHLWIMVVAMLVAVGVMLAASRAIATFVERHPSVKILALSFLMLIGVMLVAEGFGQHINKGYIYFAMGFSLFVELLNIRRHKKSQPVQLHSSAPT